MQNNTFKLLHTSDWHLGQYFHGKSRQLEHGLFLDWLVETAGEQSVDAIVVAGDIFDTGSPPSYARELYNQFIVKLHRTNVHLIVLGGNHDSVSMLSESKDLLACLNTHVIPSVLDDITHQVISLKNKDRQPQAIICAIPFLRSRDILLSAAGQTGADKQQQLQQAISDHYHAIYSLAQEQQDSIKKTYGLDVPIIATGHLTTVGAKSSESVRDIYIGTLEAFPSSGFPPADYIALGHIHRSQLVGGAAHIRYCGSPIPLSFDELNSDKTVLLVSFENSQFEQALPLEVPRFQAMQSIKGSLKDIEKAIAQLSPSHSGENTAWLSIEVTSEDYLNDLQSRVQEMVQDKHLEVLVLKRERKQSIQSMQAECKETLQELSPGDVFERLLIKENLVGAEQDENKIRMIAAFNDVYESVQQGNEP